MTHYAVKPVSLNAKVLKIQSNMQHSCSISHRLLILGVCYWDAAMCGLFVHTWFAQSKD